MRTATVAVSLLALLLSPWNASAFVIPQSRSSVRSSSTTGTTTTSLDGVSPSRIKQAGGGLPLLDAGGRQLFDPELEGKLQGTGELSARIASGSQYLPAQSASSTTTAATPPTIEAQHWLEDIGLPLNFAKPNSPVTATVLGRTRLISSDAPGDIEHVIMELPEGFHYVEGQSLSVIPPGVDQKGKPHKPRLYSIASTRYGDVLDGKTVSLCVRRAEYYDQVTGLVDPTKAGVCSNFLCDIQAGTKVSVAGPVGKTMLLPQDPDTDIIMVATGTGVAPFRAFMHRLFMEHTLQRHLFTGTAWLILGVPTTGGLLYPQEFQAMQNNASPGQLEIDYAISREMLNEQGGKLYVQHVLQQKADELWNRLDKGAHIYFCGLKGMMPGILEALEQVAISKGQEWSLKLSELKNNGQWHVEVY